MTPTDEQLIDRAYFRRYGKWADYPSVPSSTVSTRGVVRLVNCYGELARYKHDKKRDRLTFVP